MESIADVTTHAAYRRRGYEGKLMRAALDGMRERGVHLYIHAPSLLPPLQLGTRTEAISYCLEPADLPIRSGNNASGPTKTKISSR